MSNKIIYLILLLIIILGAGLRFFWLHKSPPSLNWDEAALGYNAYSLLETGKDEYGFSFPITFRSFDDYKPPLYPYLAVIFIKFFGLNEFSVRLPSVLGGIFTIMAVHALATHFFNKKVGLFASFFIAVEPWAVHFSRVAFETNLGLTFLLWSIYFALIAKEKPRIIYLSILLLFISSYAYHSYRVLLIPLVIAFLYLNKSIFRTGKPKGNLFSFLIILIIPLIFILKSGGGLVRLEATSIFRAVSFEKTSNPLTFSYQVYNLGKNMLGRYFAYFSPANLFIRGSNEPNQQIHGFGIFYPIEFVFFIVGICQLFKNIKKLKFLLFLILIAPIPAIITWNWFLPSRTLLLFSMYSLIIGFGAYSLFYFFKSKGSKIFLLSTTVFSVILLTNLGNLATTLFLYLPYSERGNWQFGFREIMNYVSPIQDNYDQIIFETGHAQPHIFVLFYGKYPPARYHNDLGSPNAVEKPRKNFNFGKYVFRNIYWPDDRSSGKTLFIGSEYSLPERDIKSTPNAKVLVDVKDRLGNFVARIVETK